MLCCSGVPHNKSCLQANADLKCPSLRHLPNQGDEMRFFNGKGRCILCLFDNISFRFSKGRTQRVYVISASDSQSGGPGFEYRSGHLLDLFSVVSS